jgi:hypothetical protein
MIVPVSSDGMATVVPVMMVAVMIVRGLRSPTDRHGY